MQIDVIRGAAAHVLCADPGFRAAWMALLARCPWATAFQSPGFVCTWYSVHAAQVEPVLLLWRDADGGLRGLLPLCRSGRDGLAVAGTVQAEYHAWICAAEDCATFGMAALRAARPLIPGRTSLHFQYLPPALPVDWLRQVCAPTTALGDDPNRSIGILRPLPRPILRLGDGKDIADSLKKSANKSKIKRLGKIGPLVFRQITDPEEFDRLLEAMIPSYNLRHAAVHGVAPFLSNPLKLPFYRQLMRVPGLLHVTIMQVGDTLAAFHAGVPSGRELQLGITMHNPWLSKHSPAKIHMLLLSKLLVEQGFDRFDLTPGGDTYKQRFANDWDTVHTLSVYGNVPARALGQFKYTLADRVRALLAARHITTSEARIRAKRLRGQLALRVLPGTIRAAGHWVHSHEEHRIYALDVANIRKDNTPLPAVRRDDEAALLCCPPTPRWPTRGELASIALSRFEAGMHVYTIRDGEVLCALGWLAEQPDADFIAELLPGFTVPAASALVFDFYTHAAHRRRGYARAILTTILNDVAANPAVRQVILPVPVDSPGALRLVSALGARYLGSVRATRRWGRVTHGSDFAAAPAAASAASPAPPATSLAVRK